MKQLELKAWSRRVCDLSHHEAAEMRSTGLVDVRAEPDPGKWQLVSESRIGVAVGDGWELRVRPALAVPQLFFLLAYALDPKGWKDQQATFAVEPDLLDAIASGFSWHALRAVEQGLLRGYVHIEERLPTIRGRIRFGDQLARSATLPLPIEVAYDDYTEDIAENQLIKTAAAALLKLPRVPKLARRRLLKLRALLDDVSLVPRPREVVAPPLTRLNERYAPSLRLAELILHASSIEVSRGDVSSIAFVFDMNRVFEDFLSISLRELMGAHGGDVRLQSTSSLDEGGDIPIRPDVVWESQGSVRAVVDAKYKALRPTGMPSADAYQMLAYCTAMNVPRGYLVYAKDSGEQSRDLQVKNTDCEIRVRTLDVENAPEVLLQHVALLVDEIAASA